MHRFNRGDSPVDFKKFARKYKTWEDFADKKKDAHSEIRDALYERQQRFCAYCERRIESCKGKNVDNERLNGHIEHLERRADVPEKTFDWSNLFLSCNRIDSCGKFKDALKGDERLFDLAEVVDPSKENPLDYFSFGANGKIGFVEGATQDVKQKVNETVRIFNLNGSEQLVATRRAAFRKACVFLEVDYDDEETEDYLKELPNDTPCISVYYAVLDRRSAYEERFASTSTVKECDA